jgi:hypothetical protein
MRLGDRPLSNQLWDLPLGEHLPRVGSHCLGSFVPLYQIARIRKGYERGDSFTGQLGTDFLKIKLMCFRFCVARLIGED